ncbi:MAG TPA: TonB-dependent receptor, partial [Chitinophagaceae bacterium]|nr:TonB-dependent receptor [Chitinophagaceae bacterium]
AAFTQLFNQVAQKTIPLGGHFLDRTSLFMVEGQYNFTDALKLADKGWSLLAGASWKKYLLNSQGTLFIDYNGKIPINEYGMYAEVSKKLFKDVLKLTGSGRYDKNDNFKGRFTPRISAVVKVAEDQNIRVSYQTAYRFPTTQNQYINLQTGSGVLIGGLPELRKLHHFDTDPVYTLASFEQFMATHNPSTLVVQQFGEYKPESSSSFEAGYKALFSKKILLDMYGYYGEYKNFLGRITTIQDPTTNPTPVSIAVNSNSKVNTWGYGFSLDFVLQKNFFLNWNFYSDDITNVPANFQAQFNTPKYRTNIGFGNSGFGPNKAMGFNIIARWQDAFYFDGDFASGPVKAFTTVDAQVSYKLTKEKLLFKLGATNLFNHYYINAYGNPMIGGLYYISIGYNVF